VWTVISIFSLLYAPTLASESTLFKVSQLGQIVVQVFQIVIALLLYKLFMESDKEQSSLIVVFGLLGVPFSMMAIIMPEAMHLAEVFWGLWLIPIGTLVIKSGMFPKWIGYLLYVGSLGYLGATVSYFLIGYVPSFVDYFTMGEIVWVIWITFVGAKKVQN
jgi:hypothetical protein